MSKEGLLYNAFQTYDTLPPIKIIKNYTDTADTGDDYLCSIVYGIPIEKKDESIYLIDVLYSSEPMEKTEQWTASLIERNKVNLTDVESNNGGRGFARVIDKTTPVNCSVQWFHQTQNKEARIFSQSATVNRRIVMPSDWRVRFGKFAEHLTTYKKNFKANKHDDIPDTLTGIIEKNSSSGFVIV